MAVIFEDQNVISVKGPDGNPVTVAKNGLSPDKLAEFKSSPGQAPVGPGVSLSQNSPSLAASPPGPPPYSQAVLTMNPEGGTPAQSPLPAPATPGAAQPDLMSSGLQKQSTGVSNEAKAIEKQAVRDVLTLDAQERALAELEKQKQAAEAKRQKDLADFQEKQVQADKEIADFKVKDFWADRSTGAKIAAAIAVGLGAYASAMTGGENNALKILDQAMSRDMDRQKMEYEKLKDRRSSLNSVYAQKMQQFGDERAAELATQSAMIERTKLQFQKSAAVAQGESAKAKAMQMIGALEEKQGQIRAELAGKQAEKAAKIQEDMQKRFVPETGTLAATEEDAKKLKESVAQVKELKPLIFEMKTLVAKHGTEDLPTSAKSRMTQLHKSIMTRLKEVEKLGVIAGPDEGLMIGMAPDPTAFWENAHDIASFGARGKQIETAYGDLSKDLDNRIASKMQAYGQKKNVNQEELDFEER
jgi:hypothetical protein